MNLNLSLQVNYEKLGKRFFYTFGNIDLDCLETYKYLLPSLEDIYAKLSCWKVSSKLHLFEAYLQIPVDEECVEHLTINIEKGLYWFNGLPFRIKVLHIRQIDFSDGEQYC